MCLSLASSSFCIMQTGILYRHTSFIILHFIRLHRFFFFLNKLKFCGNPVLSRFEQHFLTLCLCHILVILGIFQMFSLLLYLFWWSVIFDVTIAIVLELHGPCPCKTANLIDKCCVCSDCSTDRCFPVSLPCLWPSYSPRHMNLEFRPVNNTTIASICLSERNSCTSLILNQKLEMIKLSEESMSKAKTDPKLGLLWQSAKL